MPTHIDFVASRHDAPAFYSAKIDVQDVARVAEFTRRGFSLVDTALTFRRSLKQRDEIAGQRATTGLTIEQARPGDLDAIVDIAASAFRFSRFHVDPRFPTDAADRIKREWARSLACGQRGVGCLVARTSDRVVAFLGFLHTEDPERSTVIDLVAVDPHAQGMGVGAAIVNALLEDAGGRDHQVVAGTQAANRGSVRLYESLGFRLDSAVYILHGHLEASELL